MSDTSGFYKFDGELMFGPNFVDGPTFSLRRESHDQQSYPVFGWYWFDCETDARTFFNLPPKDEA